MEPLKAKDARRYAEFQEWTPYEAALLLAGCKPLPRGHVPEPDGNTPAFNLIHAVQICGPSKDLQTSHPPEVWVNWYSEYLAGRDAPEFSQIAMRAALKRNSNKEAHEIILQPALDAAEKGDPESVEPTKGVSGKEADALTINRDLIMKKAALINKHKHQWSTIERDFQDASENQLSKMAKAPNHGYWYEANSLKWAEQHGKLLLAKNNAGTATPFSSYTHLIKG